MLLLVVGDFVDVVLLGGGETGDHGSAGDGAWGGSDVGGGEAGAGGGAEIELGFEVLKIQGEVEDIGVGDGRCRGSGGSRRRGDRRGCCGDTGDAERGRVVAAGEQGSRAQARAAGEEAPAGASFFS